MTGEPRRGFPTRLGVTATLALTLALVGCGRTAPEGAFPASGTDPAIAGVQITSPDSVVTVPTPIPQGPGQAPADSTATPPADATGSPAGPEVTTTTAAPVPAETTTTTVAGELYTVVDGDTLWGLSAKFGVSIDALASANGLTDVDDLMPGQQLVIPSVQAVEVEDAG